MGRGFLAQGKCLLSFALIPTICHLRKTGCQTGALNPIFQWRPVSVRETFLESCQEGVKNLVQEDKFLSDLRYPPGTDTCLLLRSCPGFLLESKSPFFFSISLSLDVSLYFSPFTISQILSPHV